MKAAIWAPSGGNMQPWIFIVIRDEKNIKRIKAVSPGMYGSPSLIIAVCRDMEISRRSGDETVSLIDISMASQNILLEAYELGLGSCPIRSFSKKAVQRLLYLPESVVPELLISIGYPDEDPKPPKRREDVIYFERYGDSDG